MASPSTFAIQSMREKQPLRVLAPCWQIHHVGLYYNPEAKYGQRLTWKKKRKGQNVGSCSMIKKKLKLKNKIKIKTLFNHSTKSRMKHAAKVVSTESWQNCHQLLMIWKLEAKTQNFKRKNANYFLNGLPSCVHVNSIRKRRHEESSSGERT